MPERDHRVDERGKRIDDLIDEYRQVLHDSLNDLTEEELAVDSSRRSILLAAAGPEPMVGRPRRRVFSPSTS